MCILEFFLLYRRLLSCKVKTAPQTWGQRGRNHAFARFADCRDRERQRVYRYNEREEIIMELRTAVSPKDVKHYTTERLREEFLIPQVFHEDDIYLVYSHIDRIITGSAMPVEKELVLTAGDELRAAYFLQRREMGVINIGGPGIICVD